VPDVAGKRGGRGGKDIQTIALVCILLLGEWSTVTPDEAGDRPLWRFNLIANLVALPVDYVYTVAQVGIRMLDHEGFVVGAIDGPGAGWNREKGPGWRVL
jgi:hypothetical protein